jgi:tetratricopeptide (TPR) repeat protein
VSSTDPHHVALDRWREGDRDAALSLLHQALAADPLNADIHNSLGVVLGAAGDSEGAIVCFGQATRLAPDNPRYFANLGLSLHRQGRALDAIAAFSRAELLDPEAFEVRLQLGLLLRGQGSVVAAIVRLRHAVELRPDHPGAQMALATALHAAGNQAEAIESYDRVITLRSDLAHAHAARAIALQELGRLEDAIASHRTALALRPELLETRCNLAQAMRQTADLAGALRESGMAAGAHPDSNLAQFCHGMALIAAGDIDAGEAALRRSIALPPLTLDQQVATGLVQLLLGDWPPGWEAHEARFLLPGNTTARIRSCAPEWDGSDLAGRRILLFREQGLGDTLQFLRYVDLVAAKGGEILLWVPSAIAPLLQERPGLILFSGAAADLPSFDVQCSLMSLPRIFATTPDTVPDCARFTVPQARARSGGRLQVGLAWSGNPAHQNDRDRSMALSALAPVLAVGNCDFHVLQPQIRPTDRAADWPRLVDHSPRLIDFAATASLLAGLDLVISVDTAVAHLAGSMGIPVWLLLPAVPDWRWLLRRADTPWYRGMTLFRQPRAGDWSPVLRLVASALEKASAH